MAWAFDIRTALLVGALLTTVIGGLLLVVARGFAPSYRDSLRWWVAGTLMLPAGFVVLAVRDLLPPLAGIAFANALVAAGIAAYAIALETFHALPRRRARLALGVLATLAGSAWLAQEHASPTGRLPVAVALVVATLVALLACALRNLYAPGTRGRTRHILGTVVALSIAILAYRAAALFAEPAMFGVTFAPGGLQVLTYAVGSVLPVVASFGFLLMCTERSQRELERAARMDFLTGCYNRRAIEELGARAIAASRRHGIPLAVLVIDIDHFKRINDELGHAAGDEALTQAVTRVRASLRSEDLLGRMGGEEFIVLMPNTDTAAAGTAAERIRQQFAGGPLPVAGQPRAVTLSIGAAVLAPADRVFSELLRRADRAMYAAKNAGRNLVMCDGLSGWDAA